MKSITIIGDSNIICLNRALATPGLEENREIIWSEYVFNGSIVLEFVLDTTTQGTIINPMIRRSLVHADLCHPYNGQPNHYNGCLMLVFGSGLAYTLGLDRRLVDYQICGKSNAASDLDRKLISGGIIFEAAQGLTAQLERGLRLFRSFWPKAEIVVQAGPPPEFDASRAKATMKIDVCPSPEMRLEIFRRNMDALRRVTSNTRTTLWLPPAAALDQNGFLKPEFSDDGIHGTTEYGELVIRSIMQRARVLYYQRRAMERYGPPRNTSLT